MYHCAMCEYEASRKKSIRVHNGTKVFLKSHLNLYKSKILRYIFETSHNQRLKIYKIHTYIHKLETQM